MIVADATALISLAKIGRIGLLHDVFGDVLIPPAVKEEVLDMGRQRGAVEVDLIQQAADQRWLNVARPTDAEKQAATDLVNSTKLHAGEAECLAIAAARGLMAVIDEKEARLMARATGVARIGTARVLLEAFIDGKEDFGELEQAVEELATVLWVSPNAITEILQNAREVTR